MVPQQYLFVHLVCFNQCDVVTKAMSSGSIQFGSLCVCLFKACAYGRWKWTLNQVLVAPVAGGIGEVGYSPDIWTWNTWPAACRATIFLHTYWITPLPPAGYGGLNCMEFHWYEARTRLCKRKQPFILSVPHTWGHLIYLFHWYAWLDPSAKDGLSVYVLPGDSFCCVSLLYHGLTKTL